MNKLDAISTNQEAVIMDPIVSWFENMDNLADQGVPIDWRGAARVMAAEIKKRPQPEPEESPEPE